MNVGSFRKDTFRKKVSFRRAVLWHTRELSLPESVIKRMKLYGTKRVVFIDLGKDEKWIFSTKQIFAKMRLKSEGQESQYYFPIDIAKKEKIEKEGKFRFDFDASRQVYVKRPIDSSSQLPLF